MDARQYAAAFVTQCTLSLNDREGSWAGLCQCCSFVMFCAPNAKNLTEVSEKSYAPKNPALDLKHHLMIGGSEQRRHR